jgi:hypothetical protein
LRPVDFCDATTLYDDPWKLIDFTYIPEQSPGLARRRLPFNPMVCLEPAVARAVAATIRNLMSHRRRVFVDTPKGRRSAGFTVSAEADAADVSMRLRERGWAPYALRLEPEQHAWIALVMDWQRAA